MIRNFVAVDFRMFGFFSVCFWWFFFFFKQNLDNWNFFILLIQVRKPKYWTEDIQFNKVHCIGWSHSPAGGIHVCGGYSSILSSLLHFLLNVSIVTDRYDFQSISCNIQIGRCKNLILSLSLWMNCTSCVFILLTLFLHIYFYFFYLFTIKSKLGMLSDLQTTFLSRTIQKVTNLFIVDFQHAECNLPTTDRTN